MHTEETERPQHPAIHTSAGEAVRSSLTDISAAEITDATGEYLLGAFGASVGDVGARAMCRECATRLLMPPHPQLDVPLEYNHKGVGCRGTAQTKTKAPTSRGGWVSGTPGKAEQSPFHKAVPPPHHAKTRSTS